MLLRLPLFAALVPFLLVPQAGFAQNVSSPPPQVRPGWYARTSFMNNIPAAERAIMDRNLTAAERLLASTTGYDRPRGFEAKAHWIATPLATPTGLREYRVEILTYVPDWRTTSGHANGYASVVVNPGLGLLSDGGVKSETGETYNHERPRSPVGYGATVVYGEFGISNTSLKVLFTTRNQDPTLPVSREEYLRARIHEIDGDGTLRRDQAAATKTPYQQWMEGAAQRKKDREASLARMSDKAMAEKMRAAYEKQETDMAESLRKSESQDAANQRTFRELDPAKRLRDQLAAMTPQERASQAWAGGTDLMPAGAPNAMRVVRENPAFFRARGSPAEPRAVLVILYEPPQGVATAQNQLHRELDWAAIRRLLDTRP